MANMSTMEGLFPSKAVKEVGRKARFFGETWQVIGMPTRGTEQLIPLGWNMKVKVERIG